MSVIWNPFSVIYTNSLDSDFSHQSFEGKSFFQLCSMVMWSVDLVVSLGHKELLSCDLNALFQRVQQSSCHGSYLDTITLLTLFSKIVVPM